MAQLTISQETNRAREVFFKAIFGRTEGIVCLARLNRKAGHFVESYYQYPQELGNILEQINQSYMDNEVYFCPQLLAAKKRSKEYIKVATCLWADLDECHPDKLLVEPSITVESSPDRYQAFWVLESPVDPEEAEEYSKRIAYKHQDQGADVSGWDLTQLLRVPMTLNFKHSGEDFRNPPLVHIVVANRSRYRIGDFEDYPEVKAFEYDEFPMPPEGDLPELSLEEFLRRNDSRMTPILLSTIQNEPAPNADWSKVLFKLLMSLFERGFDRDEVFFIGLNAACNKWARDGKSPKALWQDVCRAWNRHELNEVVEIPKAQKGLVKDLLTNEETALVEANPTFVERYIEWASGLGDAAKQYHQAGAFTILSSLLCGNVRLPTSFGTIIPNLWFMILADTTLTRKTTAMDIAMDLIMEVDGDIVLATDGSIEGLLGTLATRPGKPSVFLRDEFSGLLEQITKRDYYAGMPELLTKMYDGKMQKRVLRKEVIEVRDPRLIVFAGGIKTKVQELLTMEQVASGFMPRFCFITAESDITRLKPIGPPTDRGMGNRSAILNEMHELQAHYQTQTKISIGGTNIQTVAPREWEVEMTQEAWLRYNTVEAIMLQAGLDSQMPEYMTPTFDRLAKSMLKASVLIAASRSREDKIVVELSDLLHAIYYMKQWRAYVIDVMNNVGKSSAEKQLSTLYAYIRGHSGVKRSQIMQNYHLTARDADQMFMTLEQRGLIARQRTGRTEQLFARSVHIDLTME